MILAIRISNNASANALLETPEYRHINQLLQLRRQVLRGEPIKLLDLLIGTTAALATEPRDKVFGLLGMAYDTGFLLPAPTYAISMDSMSREATVALLRISDSLDFIVFFARADPLTAPYVQTLLHDDKEREESCHATPSWVPNWFQGTTWSDERKTSYILGKAWFASSWHRRRNGIHHSWSTTQKSKPNFRILNNAFVCRGVILDNIDNLSTTFKEDKSLIFSTKDPRSALYKESLVYFRDLVYILTWYTSLTCSLEVPLHYQGMVEYPTREFEHMFLELFVSNHGEGTNDWAVDQIRRWLHLNDKFPIQNYTLGELLRAKLALLTGAGSEGYRHIFSPSLKEMERIPIGNLGLRNRPTKAYIEIVLASTIKILDSGRRLAVICVDETFAKKWYTGQKTGFHYGWVPGNSIPGDKVALLPSCTVPVVLRPRPAGGFWIVGDVCAKDFTQSEIGTELTNSWPEIEIY